MNTPILLTLKSIFTQITLPLILVIATALCLPVNGYSQIVDLDNDGVFDLFDLDTDNDGISNALEGRCSDVSILYNWEEAADPAGAPDFTWSSVDGYRRDMRITTSHPGTIDNLSTPQTSSGYLEMGMNVSDVSDDTQFAVYELTLSEPAIISAISILDIDSQTGFTFSSYGDGARVEFFDAYGTELPQNLVLGQALVQNADGIVVPELQNIPAAISNMDNWATYSSDELVTTIRITYYSLDLSLFDDPGDQYIYIGDLVISTPIDSDIDGVPNYADLDSDNDGIPDAIEACGELGLLLEECSLDANGDAEYQDENLDNLSDGLVVDHCLQGPIDTDGDGIADYIDLDSDDDGCADSQEAMTDAYGTNLLDYVSNPVNNVGLLLSGISENCTIPLSTQWIDSLIDEECTCDLAGEAIVTSFCRDIPNSGSVQITWTGGTAPYQITGDFTVSNPTDFPVFDQLTSGNYTVLIVDADDCESVVTFTIEELQGPIIGSIEPMIDCDVSEGQLLLTWSEGVGPFDLSGDFEAESIESPYLIENVIPGDYSLILSDVNGCQSMSIVTLESRFSVEANVQVLCEGTEFYSVIVTTPEPVEISTVGYIWNQLSPTAYGLSQIPIATSLEVIVNAVGQNCPTTYDILPPDCVCTAEAILPTEAIINCDNPVLILDGSGSSTGANYSYIWYNTTGEEIGNGLTIEVTEAGNYTLEVFDNILDCSTIAILEVIDEEELPIAAIISESTVLTCNQSEIVLSVNPQDNVSYEWILPGQSTSLSGETQLITLSGEVTLIATNSVNGCSNETSLNILEDIDVPPLTIETPQILNCELDLVILEAINMTMSQDLRVQWLDSDNTPISDEGELTSEVNLPGTYIVESTNVANGCTRRDSIEVIEQRIFPEITLIDQITLSCASPNVTLSPQVDLPANQYASQWEYEGEIISTENSIDVLNAGVYQLSVIHLETGCESSESAEVLESEGLMDVLLSTQDPSCYQSNDGVIDVVDILAGTPPYEYFIDGTNIELPLENLSEGSYSIKVIDDAGCEIIIDAILTSPPEIYLSADSESIITVPYGEDATISLLTNASSISSLDWSPEIDCNDCLTYEIANVTENQTYEVNLIDEAGCEAEEVIQLIVEYDIKLFVPNILLYGTDAALLYPQTANPDIYITQFDVFDRWGNLIFQSSGFEPNDPTYAWDATIDGRAAESGVYIYHIQYRHSVLGELQIAGDVTLMW